jgi:hypothetical protein
MTPQQARALVSGIDLNAICRKVRVQQKWDAAAINRAEREYREYLEAALLNPGRKVPPSRAADEIWHAHILDTMKYAADCDRLFGGMLHHVPNYQPYLDGTITAETDLCFARSPEEKAAAFCVCIAGRDNPAAVAGCVPCFGKADEKVSKAAAAEPAAVAGCVPCFGKQDGAAGRVRVRTKAKARRTRRVRV